VPANVTRRRLRIAMVAGAVLVIAYVLYAARSALPPFLLGSVFVIAFAPVVDRIVLGMPFRSTHPDLALSLAIGLLYLTFLSLLVLAATAWGSTALSEGRDLANDLPSLTNRAQHEFQDSNGWYRQNVPPDVRDAIEKNSQKIADQAGGYVQQLATRTFDVFTTSLTTIISYIVVPFWAFFVLKDRRRGIRAFVGLFPESVQPDVAYLLANARAVFGSFVRAQVVLATVTAIVTAIGLRMMGVRFSLALGVVAGIANLIPVIGPMLGAIPALIVVAATHPGWQILWVFLFLFVSQELKDFLLVPRVQGGAMRLHPAIILVLIVVAGHLAGFWGLLLVVPVAAVARDSFVYIYRRLGDEPVTLTPAQAAAVADTLPCEKPEPAPSAPDESRYSVRVPE